VFPAEQIRDALGLVRLLYAAKLASGRAVRGQPDALTEIGEQLRASLSYARAPQGSPEQRGAVECAANALARLADVVTMEDALADAARAALLRLQKTRGGAGQSSRAIRASASGKLEP
jgi:hypothetical protein